MSGICSAHQHHQPGCPQCEPLPSWMLYESSERVGDGTPDFVSRFRWRAERRRRKLDFYRVVPFYRYEIVREGGRWAVVAFQNLAAPPPTGAW